MWTLQQILSAIPRDLLRMALWLVLLAAIFVPLERIFALHRQKVLRKSIYADLGLYFLNSLLPSMLLILPLSVVAWAVHRVVPGGIYNWPTNLPFWIRQTAALVVGEVGAYWGHRWSHEIPWLWRFHAIHHGAEQVDWLVHTRAHPFDMVFTRLCGLVPMYLLGLAQPAGGVDSVPYIVIFLGTAWGFFIHANVKWRLGWLEEMVSTPAFHHWHHTADGPTVINKNYAALLPCVDRCFGTLHLPKQKWPDKYGIESAVGDSVEMEAEAPVPVLLH